MNAKMKKTIIAGLILVLCLALVLTGCGKAKTENEPTESANSNVETPAPVESPAAEEPQVEEPAAEPEHVEEPVVEPEPAYAPDLNALVNPEEIEWGYDAPGSSDPQHWYPDGDKLSDYYLMFDGDFLYVRDGELEDDYSVKVENGHLVNFAEDGPALDFVFTDNLTCYDMINDQWYMRADYDAVLASLTAATFYCEAGDQWNITFYEDGTYRFEQDG